VSSPPYPNRCAERLACFDLGGVLVRIAMSFEEACQFAGFDVRDIPIGEAVLAQRRRLALQLDVGSISLPQWADAMSQALDGAYTPDQIERVHYAITQEEHPGALALIDDLHAAGIATACLSNTNHEHWVRLVHRDGSRSLEGPPEYPAVQRIRHRFASHLLQLAKPDAAIYERFERLTGVRGADILFFDDREENVVAARNRGWLAEWVDARRETIPQIRARLRGERWL
jgi:FMN phosphatase YigB (HAD superfamily)